MTQIKSHTTIVSPGVFTKTKHHRVARVVDLEVSSSFVPQLQGTRINMVKSFITSVSREVSKLKHHLLGACISLVVILYQYMKSHHSFVILLEKEKRIIVYYTINGVKSCPMLQQEKTLKAVLDSALLWTQMTCLSIWQPGPRTSQYFK